ncbi:MAG: hypothetical protein AAF483_09975 [Planctomycetota bacterium]
MAEFPNTRWSLVETVVTEAPNGSRENMGILMESYWEPMYAHLRYKGIGAEKAEDLIQDFMIEILNKDLLAIANPQKGRFRTLLLTALDRFAISRHRYESASKRSPGDIASLDASEADRTESEEDAPSLAFDKAWALEVLASALGKMKEACDKEGDQARWSIFDSRVLGPLLDDADVPEYAELAEKFGLANEKAAMNILVTAKRQLGRVMREVIREYIMRRTDHEAYVAHIAKRMDISEDPESVTGLAKHLTEQSIHRMVEDELEELQKVLAKARKTVVRHARENALNDDSRSFFWDRLTQGEKNSESDIGSIFSVGSKLDNLEEGEPFQQIANQFFSVSVRDLIGNEAATQTVLECLTGRDSSLEEISELKEWASYQRTNTNSTTPRDLVNAVFLASIAAAKIRFEKSISVLSEKNLRLEFAWLKDQIWLDANIRSLAEDALEKL